MKGKIYTHDDANRMLPLVSRIADDIVTTYSKVHQTLGAFEAAKADLRDLRQASEDASDRDPATPPAEDRLEARIERLDRRVGRQLDRFQVLIEEVEALGGTVKDYERGCIDFYGEVDGEIVYLCWQRGEDAIGHWHRLDEGYARRHPLPVPHAA